MKLPRRNFLHLAAGSCLTSKSCTSRDRNSHSLKALASSIPQRAVDIRVPH